MSIVRGAVSPEHVHLLSTCGCGYLRVTAGAVDEKTIKRYIEEQNWRDGEGKFRMVTDK